MSGIPLGNLEAKALAASSGKLYAIDKKTTELEINRLNVYNFETGDWSPTPDTWWRGDTVTSNNGQAFLLRTHSPGNNGNVIAYPNWRTETGKTIDGVTFIGIARMNGSTFVVGDSGLVYKYEKVRGYWVWSPINEGTDEPTVLASSEAIAGSETRLFIIDTNNKVWKYYKNTSGNWVWEELSKVVEYKAVAIAAHGGIICMVNKLDYNKIYVHNDFQWEELEGYGKGKAIALSDSTMFIIHMNDKVYKV